MFLIFGGFYLAEYTLEIVLGTVGGIVVLCLIVAGIAYR